MASLAPPEISEAPPLTAADLPPPPPAPPIDIPQPGHHSAATRRSIVIGCDETEAAKRSIAWCLDNLATTNDKIILMRAIPLFSPTPYPPSFGLIEPSIFVMIEERKIPYEIDIMTITDNDMNADVVAQAIWRRSEELKASLIVVSKHNRGLIKEMFTGSVTAKLIHLSKLPVLVFNG